MLEPSPSGIQEIFFSGSQGSIFLSAKQILSSVYSFRNYFANLSVSKTITGSKIVRVQNCLIQRPNISLKFIYNILPIFENYFAKPKGLQQTFLPTSGQPANFSENILPISRQFSIFFYVDAQALQASKNSFQYLKAPNFERKAKFQALSIFC